MNIKLCNHKILCQMKKSCPSPPYLERLGVTNGSMVNMFSSKPLISFLIKLAISFNFIKMCLMCSNFYIPEPSLFSDHIFVYNELLTQIPDRFNVHNASPDLWMKPEYLSVGQEIRLSITPTSYGM